MTRPNFESEALDLYQRLITCTPAEGVNWLSMKLGLAYQSGVVDGLAQASEAVNAAFDAMRGKP